MKTTATITAMCFLLASVAGAQDAGSTEVTDRPPAEASTAAAPQAPPAGCVPIKKGGPIAGIVVASVFWWVLPMSIPVWITQAKKLKKLKRQEVEQYQRGCPPS